ILSPPHENQRSTANNLACEHSRKGSGRMERIAIAMQDGGAGAGARHEAAARAARLTSFYLAAEPLYGRPGRGTFWFQIFIQASSPEIWSETTSGGEEVLAR